MKRRRNTANNQGILLLATLAAIQIAQGLDRDQIETLSAFFEVLGDNLALLIAPPYQERTYDGETETVQAMKRETPPT